MKKIKKLLTVILALVMCLMTSMVFVACEDAYSADETDELIAKLQEIIDDNKKALQENEQAIADLKSEYEEQIEELTQAKRITGIEYVANGDLIITFGDGTTQLVRAPQKEECIHTYGEWKELAYNKDLPAKERLSYRICELCGGVEWAQTAYLKQNLTVDIGSYDTAKGTVSLDKDDYEYGDIITVTVSAKSGFYVKSLTVNGVEKKAELSSNSYNFELLDNTTINVEFKEKEDLSIITNATVSSFDRDINRSGKVLLVFWAENCYSFVNILAPQLEQLANDFGEGEEYAIDLDVKIVKVRVSRDYIFSNVNARYPEYEILTRYESYYNGGTPFVVMLEDGEVIGTLNGAYSEYNSFLNWMQNPTFI